MPLTNGGDDFDVGEDTPIVEQMRKIGKIGGQHTKVWHPEHFTRVGRLGGMKTARNHDHEYFVELGRKGGLARAKRRNESKGTT